MLIYWIPKDPTSQGARLCYPGKHESWTGLQWTERLTTDKVSQVDTFIVTESKDLGKVLVSTRDRQVGREGFLTTLSRGVGLGGWVSVGEDE